MGNGIDFFDGAPVDENGRVIRESPVKWASGKRSGLSHRDFYDLCVEQGVRTADIGADTVIKTKLLVRAAPETFGDGGSQPLDDYTSAQVGVVFRGYVANVKRRCGIRE